MTPLMKPTRLIKSALRTILSVALLCAVVSLMQGCAGCGSPKSSREELSAAQAAGHSRALELSADTTIDTLLIETTLLEVRERETRLRSHGHNDAADAYIASFLATLDSVNPNLAATLR